MRAGPPALARSYLAALMSDEMQVLFLQGGASTAFANVPLNLSKAGDSVDHIVTGSWSKKATQEAQKYCKVNVAAKGDNKHVPAKKDWKLQKQAKYVHYCDNETIQVQILDIFALHLACHQLPRSYGTAQLLHCSF